MSTAEVTIRVDLPPSSGAAEAVRAIRKLRQQGVPVIGRFALRGVAHGRLEMFKDASGIIVWQWTGVPDEPESELI